MSSLIDSSAVKRNYEGIPIPKLKTNLRSSVDGGKVNYVNYSALSLGVYHYLIKVYIKATDGYMCFGYKDMSGDVDKNSYIKFLVNSAVVFEEDNEVENISDINAEEGVELIYDMNRKTMSIRYGNGVEKQILKGLPDSTYLYIVKYNDSKFVSSKSWFIPPFIIQRCRIKDKHFTLQDNVYICEIKEEYDDDLYKYKEESLYKIDYVVCDIKFKHESSNKYEYIINKEMSYGIYHFYFEILSVGSEGISLSYCQNSNSYIKLLEGKCLKFINNGSTEIQDIFGVVGGKYEVIYNMNVKEMWIKQGNKKRKMLDIISERTKPIISIGDENGSVRLVEYYKEKEGYELYDNIELKNYAVHVDGDEVIINEMNVRFGNDVVNEVVVPNTIYGIYNYKKYSVINYLSNLLKTNSHYDIDNLKKDIMSIFILQGKESEYMNKSGNINELLVLLKYFHGEDPNLLDSPDSFVEIVNDLSVSHPYTVDENKIFVESDEYEKYLEFTNTNESVFQFPMKKIYIRSCYYDMFRDICKCLSVVRPNGVKISNVVVTGQPGIGKTSFIYVLLFSLKIFLMKEKLTEEINDIRNSLPNDINQEQLMKKIKEHKDSIRNGCKRINELKKEIVSNYEIIKHIIEGIMKQNHMEEEDDDEESETTNISSEETQNLSYLEFIKKTINIINDGKYINKFEIDGIIDENEFNKYKSICGNTVDSIYYLSSKIKNSIGEIDNIRNSVYIERLLLLLKTKTDELKFLNKDINYSNYNVSLPYFKDIYIIKGKRNGDPNEKKIYLLRDGVIFKIKIPLQDINDSLIIVDTINEEFGDNNKIISISSPDSHNYDKYSKPEDLCKELYFESLEPNEINEWFDNCIGFNKDGEFNKICNKYGYIPRQIYYHYLYRENFGNDYWIYYQQLMEGAIGSTGYIEFKEECLDKKNLQMHPLSNLILKYKLRKERDDEVGNEILKPENELIYVSNSVKNYIECKFYPPKNVGEFDELNNKYTTVTDSYNKRMTLKHIIAYRLSIIKNFIGDLDFELNSKKEVSLYYHDSTVNIVYFILDEDNFFDLIVDGVFIKVLLDDGKLDNDEMYDENSCKEKIKESIKDYSENGKLMYYVVIGNTLSDEFIISHILDEEEEKKLHKKTDKQAKVKEDRQIKAKEKERMKKDKEVENQSPPPPMPIPPPEEEDFDVYVNGNKKYLMRKCFDKMLNIISKDNFVFNYQRNYLLFGHAKIGKTVLAHILKDKLKEIVRNINVYLEFKSQQDESPGINFSKPYIVIVDGPAIGEDDYADAKMIIMIADASDEKCKTFQSKRCPLLMYIPPFTKEEVEKVVKLDYGKFKVNYKRFIKYDSIKDDSNGNTAGTNGNTAGTNGNTAGTNGNTVNLKKQLYLDNYEYYGGIIGNCDYTKDIITRAIPTVNFDLIKEMIGGISKSSLSKVDYQNIIIYETDENDVTVSNNLRFISRTIRDMVYDKLFKPDDGCEIMIRSLSYQPTGSSAGELYEKVIFHLMNYFPDFQEFMIKRMRESIDKEIYRSSKRINYIKNTKCLNDLKELLNNKRIMPIDVKENTKLKEEIMKFKGYNDDSIMPFINFSYDKGFPDIDSLIGPFGVQVTIGEKHTYAPDMAMILQNLYKVYIEGYNILNDSYKTFDNDSISNFGYFFITTRSNVCFDKTLNRTATTYPDIFQDLLKMDLSDDEKKKLYDCSVPIKVTVTILIAELKKYGKLLKEKRQVLRMTIEELEIKKADANTIERENEIQKEIDEYIKMYGIEILPKSDVIP